MMVQNWPTIEVERGEPLTRRHLDALRCQDCGVAPRPPEPAPSLAGGLTISPACHKAFPLFVRYHDGVLYLSCCVCKAEVAELRVAE